MTAEIEIKCVQSTKLCRRCKVEKSIEMFCSNKQSSDGKFWWCKQCQSKHYALNVDHRRKQNAERYAKIKLDPIKLERWKKISLITSNRSKQNHKDKNSARLAVRYAIKCGKLVRPDFCSACGTEGVVEAHHDSYEKEKWLDVKWLCRRCHSSHHRKYPDTLK